MSSWSQGLEFLDLSGVSQDERQELLSLVSGANPAVLVLAPDTSAPASLHPAPQAREEEEEEHEQEPEQEQEPEPEHEHEHEHELEHEHEQHTCGEEEPHPPSCGMEEQTATTQEQGVYGDDESKMNMVADSATPINQDPASTTSSTATATTTSTTTTTTTSVTLVSSSYGGAEGIGPRAFTVPPPSLGAQGQAGGQQVYQPYPTPSPGNPPMYNPHMPPPSHPPHFTQMPPPPVLPPGATVYVANCHVNFSSSHNGGQGHVPVLASTPGPSQSPPPPSPAVVPPIHVMPEPTPQPHPPQIKPVHEGKPEFESRRNYDPFRGGHRGRGRGRGRGKRLNIERAGGEHPGYGGEKHYHEAAQFGGIPGPYVYQNLPYHVRGGSGYPPYPNVPTAQNVQGMPLMYGQQYVQYAHAHGPVTPLLSYPSGPPGSQHHPALQHLHHQHPHHHPIPQQQHHHFHPQQQHHHHQQQQPQQQQQPEPESPQQEHQFHLQQPQPQPNFAEPPEVVGSSNLHSNQLFVSTSQTRTSQFESVATVGVSAPAVNFTPSVTAPAEAGSVSPLTSQTASLVLEECVETRTSPMGIVSPGQDGSVPVGQEGEEVTAQPTTHKLPPAHHHPPLHSLHSLPLPNLQVPPPSQSQGPTSGQTQVPPSPGQVPPAGQNQVLPSNQVEVPPGQVQVPPNQNQEALPHQAQVPSSQAQAPPSGQNQISPCQNQVLAMGQAQVPPSQCQGQVPPPGLAQLPPPGLTQVAPPNQSHGQAPPASQDQTSVPPPGHNQPPPLTHAQIPLPSHVQAPPPGHSQVPPPTCVQVPPSHTQIPPPGLAQAPPPGLPQVPPPGLPQVPPPGLPQVPPPGLAQLPPPCQVQIPPGHSQMPPGQVQELSSGQVQTQPAAQAKPPQSTGQSHPSPSHSHATPKLSLGSNSSNSSDKSSSTPQVLFSQMNKGKMGVGIEQTSLADITFMSDEIQPDVVSEIAVDFARTSLVAPEPSPSSVTFIPALSVAESPTPQVNTPAAASESGVKQTNSDVGMIGPSSNPPVASSPVMAEVVIPQLAAASALPGGAWAQKKSWSQLFKPCDEGGAKQVAYVAPFNQGSEKLCEETSVPHETTDHKVPDPTLSEADIEKAKIGGILRQYVQDHHHAALQPRGLINKANWCYINAPLQALLACPPFYNLMKSIPNIAGLKKGKSSTPVIDSIVEYIHEFSEMSPMLKPCKKDKSGSGARKETEIVPGPPFEPSYVYKMLATINGDLFSDGRQQDAEEMLSFVLNGLHEEMVEALKLAGEYCPSPTGDHPALNGSVNGETNTSDHEDGSDDSDEWQMMGPRKRCCVTRTAAFTPTPISAIFWGQLRSVLHQAGGHTANLQPFTTLPLDIQSSKVESVKDALDQLVSREEIPDYTDAKTNQDVTVFKQVLLEHLPNVLILQLKRFIYDKDGGLQKVMKKVNFPIDLEITKELMSSHSRGKFSHVQRKYKLLGVVYHDGKEATKGHYVADIYHGGYNCWLRCDDSFIKEVPESNVVRHVPPRVPYLLFYRRADTMVGPSTKTKS